MRIIPHEIFHEKFDMVIIGGGINGAGIALDAASRGFKVLLLEKNDFGSGTTSASTKLIHGGLRYLQYFEVGLVRESLREREILLKIAPHLVKPLPLTFPFYEDEKKSYKGIRVGLIAYDVLSYDKSLERHKVLKEKELINLEPSIVREKLTGGAIFYDCQIVYPERLCIENLLIAKKLGATILNYAKVVDIKVQKKKVIGLTFLDIISNIKYDINCDFIINVTGPWVDSVCQMMNKNSPRKIGGTKGSHIIVKKFDNGPNTALYFNSKLDGRPLFVIPWRKYYIIGTTDKKHEGSPDDIVADSSEIDYLIRETNRILPHANLKRENIIYSYSGVRPLPLVIDVPEDSITREHFIFDHQKNEKFEGMISIIGGKLTTYRSLAKEVMSLVCSKLHRRVKKIGCKTDKISLFGEFIQGSFDDFIEMKMNEISKNYTLDEDTIRHLLNYYGLRAYEIIDFISRNNELSLKIHSEHPDVVGQIYYSLLNEHAETAMDILLRRTTIGSSEDLGLNCIERVAAEMGKYRRWGREMINFEIDRYHTFINSHYMIR